MKKLFAFLVVGLATCLQASASDQSDLSPGSKQQGNEGLFSDDVFSNGYDQKESEVVIPFGRNDGGASDLPGKLYLHVRAHVQCAYFYAKHEHESFVTRDAPSGPRFPIESLSLLSTFGGSKTSKTCNNSSSCGRTEKEYNLGCRESCAAGRATDPRYGTWATKSVCV